MQKNKLQSTVFLVRIQNFDMATYFLKSVEHRTYTQKYKCIVRKVVDDNKLLVELDPVIPMYVYNSGKDINLIVLAPRYEGINLTATITEWPVRVNMCLPKQSGVWDSGPWRLLDVGELTEN